MPQPPPETYGPEAFRLISRDVLKLDLNDEELERLHEGVNALLAELRPLAAIEPGTDEPATTFAVDPEGWTR